MPIKVGLVAHDVAPCLMSKRLGEALVAQGIEVRMVLSEAGKRNFSNYDIGKALAGCDVVVIGMSSSPELSKLELQASLFVEQKSIPFGFYADTFGAYHRAWFEPFRASASFVFVLNYLGERERAQSLFPNALVFPTGNPEHFGYSRWLVPRDTARLTMGFEPDDFVVLVPGGKVKDANFNLLGAVSAALNLANFAHASVVFSLHPGDKNSPEDYERACSLLTHSQIRFLFTPQSVVSTSNVLCASDLVVGSSPSLDMEAGYKTIPTIFFMPSGQSYLLSLELERRDWPPCSFGASLLAESWWDIYRYLEEDPSFLALRSRQTEIYKKTNQEEENPSIVMMVEALLRFVGR